MGHLDDMRAKAPDASAAAFAVRRSRATDGYGVARSASADAMGASRTLGTAYRLSDGAGLALPAAQASWSLLPPAARGSRIGDAADADAVADGLAAAPAPRAPGALAAEARRSLGAWLAKRPEAAWNFIKEQMHPAWEPAGPAADAAAREGFSEMSAGANAAAGAPYRLDRARRVAHSRAEGRLARWDAKADLHQAKADKIARRIADAQGGDAARTRPISEFRQRLHQAKAQRLRGEGGGIRARVFRARRAKNGLVSTVTQGRFLLMALAGLLAVPLALFGLTACSVGVLPGVVAAIGGSQGAASAQLSAVENQVASFFMSKGLDTLRTAAIMGNIYGESGMEPALVEDNGIGIGLCQWSYKRADALRSFAASRGKDWSDIGTQLEFFWDHDVWQSDWSSIYRTSQQRAGDPPAGTLVSGSKGGFMAAASLDGAVEQFCYGWERPGTPRMGVRKEAAQRYYAALTGLGGGTGPGQEYAAATDAQKAVAAAATRTPSPGAGWCARWVSDVMNSAGYGRVSGNADDMYARWCTSSDRSELKVGMIIAVDRYVTDGYAFAGHAPDGRALSYHVGVYVGDGKVMDNIGAITTTDLDRWVAYYGNYHPVRWGWANGIDLSAR